MWSAHLCQERLKEKMKSQNINMSQTEAIHEPRIFSFLVSIGDSYGMFLYSLDAVIKTSIVKLTFIQILLRQASHYHQMTDHVTDGRSDPRDRGDSVTAARLMTLA